MKFKSSPGRAVVELWLGLGKASAKLESSLGNRLVGPWCCPTVNSRTPKRKSDRPHTWLQQSSAVAFLGVAEQHLQCQGGALAMAWHVIGPCRLEWPRGRLTCQAIERLRLKLMASAPAKTRTTSVEWSQLVATHTHTRLLPVTRSGCHCITWCSGAKAFSRPLQGGVAVVRRCLLRTLQQNNNLRYRFACGRPPVGLLSV